MLAGTGTGYILYNWLVSLGGIYVKYNKRSLKHMLTKNNFGK